MSVADNIINEMLAQASPEESAHLMRFFKTGKGEYGEGDRFLGVRVPFTRSVVKKYRKETMLKDVAPLLASEYHEIRLAGFLLLVDLYQRARKGCDSAMQRRIVDYYLSVIERGNNWDLVDLVCYKLLGEWLADNHSERGLLDHLASMDGHLWHQRVAMVSTMAMIKRGEFCDTFRLAEQLLDHRHDLIHKAVGWMLREVGKRGGRPQLEAFLHRHAANMPRTTLRYAIEHFSKEQRKHFLSLKSGDPRSVGERM